MDEAEGQPFYMQSGRVSSSEGTYIFMTKADNISLKAVALGC